MPYELLDDAPSGRYELLDPVSVSAGKAVNSGISDIPRQLGLTARYGMEGLANTAQIVTEPIRNLITDPLSRLFGGSNGRPLGQEATKLADRLGLPMPQTADERVVGDAARLMAGSGGLAGSAQAASALPNMAGKVFSSLASNPMQQISSAAGAGLAGGASKEAGGNDWLQAGASLLGGVAGGFTPNVLGGIGGAVKNMVTPKLANNQIDIQLTTIFGKSGVDFNQYPEAVKNQLRTEMASSLKANKSVNSEALGRLADFKSIGVTPTRGMISQNPVDITREMNLAKIGANSADGQLQGLPMIQNQNNQALINSLNAVGGSSNTAPIVAGRALVDRVGATQQTLRSAEQSAWDAAKSSAGYKQPIYPDGLNAMNAALGESGMMAFMPKPITSYMEAFQTGQQPFTPQAYRNLQSMLAGEMAAGGNTAAAAKIARNALESAPMKAITNPNGVDLGLSPMTSGVASLLRKHDAQPANAIKLIDQARAATRSAYGYEDSSPLVKSVLSGARSSEPENIAKSFLINGTVGDARAVVREMGPDGIPVMRNAIATYIKEKALGNSSDEIGKVSQSQLNSTLKSIGDEKLAMFFSKEELTQLKTTGRVAGLMQSQPIGSAVNNSNSGALMLGRGLDNIDSKLKLLPFGQIAQMGITGPLRNINTGIQSSKAQNVLPGLLNREIRPSTWGSLILPATAAGGGLLSP